MKHRNDLISRSLLGAAMLVCAVAGLAPVAAQVVDPISGDPVAIDTGKVAGTLLPSGVRAYLGIPYAAPPVDKLRWHAPEAVAPWTGTYMAAGFKPACVQRNIPASRAYDIAAPLEPVSEDCLYLNVWAPPGPQAGGKLPVIVFIHGGGFTSESPNRADYRGSEIAKKGVVQVSIGYRLGVFGYLAHPEMTAQSGHGASGNWGVLDQIAALKWVQRNISAFGGDPANVTIVGHSAGSESVYTLQSSPLAKGLFAKVSGWSGANLPPGGRPPRMLAEAEADGMKVQANLKVRSLAEMRTVPWDKVIGALGGPEVPGSAVPTRPVVDGYVLPDLPETLFREGRYNDVPLLASSTNADLGISRRFAAVKTLAHFQEAAKADFGAAAPEFLKLFPARNDAQAVEQAGSVVANQGFGIANRDWARSQASVSKQPVYLVQFRLPRPYREDVKWIGPKPEDRGAFHGSDIAFWLGTWSLGGALSNSLRWTDWDKALSEKMVNALTSFARTGSPSTDALTFPRYDVKNEQRLILGTSIHVEKMNTRQIEFLRAHAGPR